MISIVLVVTVCTTGSAIAQAVECDVPQYTFSDENIEIVDPALFYDLFTQENDINAIQDDTLDASYKYTFAPWEDNADKSDVSVDFVVVVNGVPAYGSATGVVDAYDIVLILSPIVQTKVHTTIPVVKIPLFLSKSHFQNEKECYHYCMGSHSMYERFYCSTYVILYESTNRNTYSNTQVF